MFTVLPESQMIKVPDSLQLNANISHLITGFTTIRRGRVQCVAVIHGNMLEVIVVNSLAPQIYSSYIIKIFSQEAGYVK